MACYHPLDAYRARYAGPSGKKGIVFDKRESNGVKLQIPCGQCIGCRLEHSRQWAMRCMHESSLYDSNCFVTLTYSPEKLPATGTLVKKHYQDFMKRLRFHIAPKRVRFFHCGEYGEEHGRPHYHACLFGYDFPDRVLYKDYNGTKLYSSATLERLWGFGFATVGDVTFESAAYVARYVLKKMTGPEALRYYEFDPLTGEVLAEREREYTTMSRRPGIGQEWYRRFSKEVYPDDEVIVRGKKVKPPKYYDRLLEAAHAEVYTKVKEERERAGIARASENTPERLYVREKVAKARLGFLKRGLESEL